MFETQLRCYSLYKISQTRQKYYGQVIVVGFRFVSDSDMSLSEMMSDVELDV